MTTHNLIFLVYPGFELLDLSGPVSVFSNVNALCKTPPYKITVVSITGGLIESDSAIVVSTNAVDSLALQGTETLFVVGGNSAAISAASTNNATQLWLKKISRHVTRYGSICSGAFVLAAADLLEKKTCTTHWAGAKILQEMYPNAIVQPESLYVIDGKLWTSAGVTTGLDMALEMVRQDLGNTLMTQVAKQLVVYSHRPGNQSQFSHLLKLQSRTDSTYSNLLAWVDENIGQTINVADMAKYMCMTERTFYRKFTAAFDVTPSKYVEEVKLERAKNLLENAMPVSQVAEAIGFKSESAFRARFESRFGLTPAMHKRLHSGT